MRTNLERAMECANAPFNIAWTSRTWTNGATRSLRKSYSSAATGVIGKAGRRMSPKSRSGRSAGSRALLESADEKPRRAFDKFVVGLRNNLNPAVSQDDAVEML